METKPHAIGDIVWFWSFDRLESGSVKTLRPNGEIYRAGNTYGGNFHDTRTAAIEARIAEEEGEVERARTEIAIIDKRILKLEAMLEEEVSTTG